MHSSTVAFKSHAESAQTSLFLLPPPLHHATTATEGGPKTWNFLSKKLNICSCMFKLKSPSKYSPFDAIHLSKCFFHCSKQFLNFSIFMPFSVSAIFCFTSSTWAECFPLKTFFQPGKQKNVTRKVAGCEVG